MKWYIMVSITSLKYIQCQRYVYSKVKVVCFHWWNYVDLHNFVLFNSFHVNDAITHITSLLWKELVYFISPRVWQWLNRQFNSGRNSSSGIDDKYICEKQLPRGHTESENIKMSYSCYFLNKVLYIYVKNTFTFHW